MNTETRIEKAISYKVAGYAGPVKDTKIGITDKTVEKFGYDVADFDASKSGKTFFLTSLTCPEPAAEDLEKFVQLVTGKSLSEIGRDEIERVFQNSARAFLNSDGESKKIQRQTTFAEARELHRTGEMTTEEYNEIIATLI